MSIESKAIKADGKRFCSDCPIYKKGLNNCTPAVFEACSYSFRKGFIKGYKTKSKEINESKRNDNRRRDKK